MNTGPAAWDDVDPLSQWIAELLGGGPDNKPAPGPDHTGPCSGDRLGTQQPGDDR